MPKFSEMVTFEPKVGPKPDCINKNAEYQCPNESTLEAVYKKPGGHPNWGPARVRCCTDQKCKERAAEFAIAASR